MHDGVSLQAMNQKKFNDIKQAYGDVASWALWSDTNDGDTSDVSILDPNINDGLFQQLHTNYVLVALNISGQIKTPFGNFHGGKRDFMLRDAVKDTPLEGAYMTDLIKNYEEKNSSSVVHYFEKNTSQLQLQIAAFHKELANVGANSSTVLIGLGGGVCRLLEMAQEKYRFKRLTHYSYRNLRKDEYRQEVNKLLLSLEDD